MKELLEIAKMKLGCPTVDERLLCLALHLGGMAFPALDVMRPAARFEVLFLPSVVRSLRGGNVGSR